ncbi:MAG: hypothetical protein ACRDIX_07240 [Actinomycetota bacterium]
MTPPRKPRDFREEIIDLKGALDELLKAYPDAHEYGYWPPSRGGGGGHVSHEDTDPTSATFAARGRVRGLLRKINGKVNLMVRVAGEAQDTMDDIFEQGPLLNDRPVVRIPSPAAAVHEEDR